MKDPLGKPIVLLDQWVHKNYDEILVKIIQDQKGHKKRTRAGLLATLVPTQSQSLQSRNAHFLWYLFYVEVLSRIHHSRRAKKAVSAIPLGLKM
ncbi:unnamed protein product [Rotaria magnacalcarata]|uniref:Uncharacterized protein n=3 Tax=Rotaria magnacalcarata TaxID=392030 RepID=A0A820CHI8_9BILA|nr:unnamed protein product [Rotaria magnacalcarata]